VIDRRLFLAELAAGAAGLIAGGPLLAADRLAGPVPPPVRIRGRVTRSGRAAGGVAVSDGLGVVRTDPDGFFELVSSRRYETVFVTVPADCRIPRSASGTARIHRHIRPDAGDSMEIHFALEALPGGSDRHHLFAIGDPQIQDDEDIRLLHEEAVPDLRAAATALAGGETFGVALGDIMYDRPALWPDWERAVERTGITCLQVPGNHDVDPGARTDRGSLATYVRRAGPTHYSFDRGAVHYVVLDDVFWFGGYLGYVDRDQLDWLARDLALVDRGRPVVLFMHIPPWTEGPRRAGRASPGERVHIVNREALYELIEPWPARFVCGHLHEVETLRDGNAAIDTCGALCGAWWTGPICSDGSPRGFMIYTIDGESITRRYRALGEPAETRMRLYPPGADPERPGAVVANIWEADARWRVVRYEDGERRGPMPRHDGFDPLAVQLFRGDDRPARRSWVEPMPTAHLFSAVPSPGAREIVVEASGPAGELVRGRIDLR